ncbi:salivary gland secretion 1 [Rhodotorula toruloides]
MQDGRETPYLRPLFAGQTYSESVSVDGLISRRRRRRALIIIVPPPILLSAFSSSASLFSIAYGPPERFESGALMSLQGSLGAQLALIAREYGLPSIAGLSLYLSVPESLPAAPHAHAHAGPPPKRYAPRLTAETWSTLWSAFFEGTSDEYTSSGAPSLPIAGRIEFDFDLSRATWLRELVEDAPPRTLRLQHPFNLPSAHESPASQAEARSISLDDTENDGTVDSAHAEDNGSVLADYIETTQSSSSIRTSTPRASITSPPPPPSVPLAAMINDSGFAEPSLAAKDTCSSPTQLNRSFTFPPSTASPARGGAASISLFRASNDAGRLGENDWTAQLDRLREISETSMLEGVEHASQLGSFDASGSLGELLMSIVEEERDDEVAPTTADVVDMVQSVEAAGATQLVAPVRPSASFQLPYPVIQPYPPVYPSINLYPSIERFGTAFERQDEPYDALRANVDSPTDEATHDPLVPDIALSLAVEPTHTANPQGDFDFPAHLSLDPLTRAAGPASPLPSPTITPASLSRSSTSSSSDAHDYPVDFDDYTLEVTEALSSTLDYSGELDSLGLDHADDYFVLNTSQAPLDGSSDSESDTESQSSTEEDAAVDRELGGLVEVDDACRTFDVPSSPLPPSPEPVLFAFHSLAESRDLLDAVALFVLEAQGQSIDRRGAFSVAVGGTSAPLSLLQKALEGHSRVRWDHWCVACPSGLPEGVLEAFGAAVPLARIRRHDSTALRLAAKEAAEDDREEADDSQVDKKASPRFDLALLDINQDLGQLETPNSPAQAPRLLDDLDRKAPNDPFSLSHLATSRRLTYIAIGASQHSSLRNLLRSSDSLRRLDLANGHPAAIFADEDAVEDIDYPRSAFWDGEEESADSRAEV